MKYFHCDVCGNEVVNPVDGLSFFYIKEYSLCEGCKEGLDAQLKPFLRAQQEHSIADYENAITSFINDAQKQKSF